MSEYKTLSCAEVSVGDKLPPLDIDVTTGLVVGGALATRDFEPVHHDKAVAQAAGLPDVFMNILTSQGLMTRFATDWSGPEAVVKSLDIRLGAPNVPGMVMTITGEVTAKDDARPAWSTSPCWARTTSGACTCRAPCNSPLPKEA